MTRSLNLTLSIVSSALWLATKESGGFFPQKSFLAIMKYWHILCPNPSPIFPFRYPRKLHERESQWKKTPGATCHHSRVKCSHLTVSVLSFTSPVFEIVFDIHRSEKEILRLLLEGNADQKERESKQNKTGSRQCTPAVWYICWNLFYTPQRIDALFTVRISFPSLVPTPVVN